LQRCATKKLHKSKILSEWNNRSLDPAPMVGRWGPVVPKRRQCET
jgi:hypothetical protein